MCVSTASLSHNNTHATESWKTPERKNDIEHNVQHFNWLNYIRTDEKNKNVHKNILPIFNV